VNLPKTVKWRDLKRLFAAFGLAVHEGKSRGHRRKRHALVSDRFGNKFPIPAHNPGDDIHRTYIEAARRRFGLTPQRGISDEDFYGRF